MDEVHAPLLEGVLLRCHRRFLADVRLADSTLQYETRRNDPEAKSVTRVKAETMRANGCKREKKVGIEHREGVPGSLIHPFRSGAPAPAYLPR